jgi:hypothetical protein
MGEFLMLKKLATLASCIALAQLAIAEGEDEEVIDYKTVGNWSIRIDPTLGFRCFAFASYEGTTGLRIGSDADGEGYYFNVADTMWRSLNAGEKYTVDVEFDGYGPWEANASGFDWGGGLKGLWISVNSEFMSEFSKAGGVIVRFNDQEIANLDLAESGKAMAVLLECEQMVDQVMADEGLDPFANAPLVSADPFSSQSQFRDDPFLVTD